MLALHLNLPLTDLEGFLQGRIIATGNRYALKTNFDFAGAEKIKKILVIDDSLASGNTMRLVKEKILAAKIPGVLIYTAAIYIVPGQENAVDFFAEACSKPRMFEWNIMHNPRLGKCCIDIDGVICRNPSKDENDDGPRYARFLESCEPLFLPTVPLGYLVTCRLEKYRSQTEAWLKKNKITYKQLFMMNLPDKKSRKQADSYAEFKAAAYKETKAGLFIESSAQQAQGIANISGQYVYCVETKSLCSPGGLLPQAKLKARVFLKQLLFYRPKNALKNSFLYGKIKSRKQSQSQEKNSQRANTLQKNF